MLLLMKDTRTREGSLIGGKYFHAGLVSLHAITLEREVASSFSLSGILMVVLLSVFILSIKYFSIIYIQ